MRPSEELLQTLISRFDLSRPVSGGIGYGGRRGSAPLWIALGIAGGLLMIGTTADGRSAPGGPNAATPEGAPSVSGANAGLDIALRPVPKYREPGRPEARGAGSLAMDVTTRLGVVLALVFASAAVWKRVQAQMGRSSATGADTPSVQVGPSIPLAPQRFLHVVSVGGRRLLIGSTPGHVALLADLDDAASVARLGARISEIDAPGARGRSRDVGTGRDSVFAETFRPLLTEPMENPLGNRAATFDEDEGEMGGPATTTGADLPLPAPSRSAAGAREQRGGGVASPMFRVAPAPRRPSSTTPRRNDVG